MRIILIYLLLTCQILANAQITTTSVSGGSDGDNCVVSDTRNNLIALRSAGGLIEGCHYILTDHVQGRLVSGTTISLHAVSPTEFSENVSVNTTYDNEGWRGIYDIDLALVLELQDNRNNIARGSNGNEVTNFDWGNTFITNVLLDNSTWITTYGQTRSITNVEIKGASLLNTTTWAGGTINRLYVSGGSTVNIASANVSLLNFNIYNGSSVNLSTFTAGSTMLGYNIYNSTINCSNSTQGVTINTVTMYGSALNHTGVTSGTITGSNLFIENTSTINHNNGAGNLSLNRVKITNNSIITHTSGVIALSDYFVESNSQIIQQTGVSGNISLSSGRIIGSSTVQNLADYNINGTRFSASENSSLTIQTGALGTGTFTSTTLTNGGSILISSTSTAGNASITNSSLSGGLIQKQNTGALTVSSNELNTGGRIVFNTTRNLSCSRTLLTNLATINATAVTGAGITDQIADCVADARATITISATGAVANSILYSNVNGLSGLLTITGTSSGQLMQRCTAINATIIMSNNTANNTIDLSIAEEQGNISIQNMTITKSFQYFNCKNSANIIVNAVTGAGSHSYLFAENGGNITISGGATVSQYLFARNQGAITQNGGQSINITKEMVGTITTGAFNHSNLIMISPQSITLTGSNINRTTYFGLVSTVPLF